MRRKVHNAADCAVGLDDAEVSGGGESLVGCDVLFVDEVYGKAYGGVD